MFTSAPPGETPDGSSSAPLPGATGFSVFQKHAKPYMVRSPKPSSISEDRQIFWWNISELVPTAKNSGNCLSLPSTKHPKKSHKVRHLKLWKSFWYLEISFLARQQLEAAENLFCMNYWEAAVSEIIASVSEIKVLFCETPFINGIFQCTFH